MCKKQEIRGKRMNKDFNKGKNIFAHLEKEN